MVQNIVSVWAQSSKVTLVALPQSQYVYIHDALSEYITCGDTSFALMNARIVLRDLSSTQGDMNGFHRQFQVQPTLYCVTFNCSCTTYITCR